LLKSAVSDYIDRIVHGRGLRQRVITQPRPQADIELATVQTVLAHLWTCYQRLKRSILKIAAHLWFMRVQRLRNPLCCRCSGFGAPSKGG
jgi:hypothetical protein